MPELRKAVKLQMSVVRKSDELGIIWGYASVADITDLQGDVIPQDELVKAVYRFVSDYHSGQATIRDNHGDDPAPAVLVESTFHFLGTRLAWFVGVKLNSEDLLESARKGEISGFSIGGWAQEAEE
ncbi:MAG TPA: XkdF-like putative serine protease domain-containing protein [Bryobacteraceae bacterium]|nr:XkdF-like putative serine protease domain-containing protein [Bryobacteraceae bacterium]